MPKTLLILCLALFLPPPDVPAQGVYRWVDEHGRVHYADRPAHDDAEAIRLDPVPPAAPGPGHEARREQRARIGHMFAREREKKAAARAAEARRAAVRDANCAAAQRRLEGLTRASAVYHVNEDGDRVYFSARRRAAETRRARDAVDAWCR